jgi:predicted phosphohydrolase
MNFQYASDLHLEFAQNKKVLLKKPLLPSADTLLLAGDIMPLCDRNQHQDFLNYISDHFKMTYWLPGNHEYFGTDLATMPGSFEEAIRTNIILLNNKVKRLDDPAGPIQLIFSTLWSHIPPHLSDIVAKRMRDFKELHLNGKAISPLEYNQLHQEALHFLTLTLEDKTESNSEAGSGQGSKLTRKMVISHHLPSFLNYPKKHQNDPINAGFASNLDDFIQKTAPNAWIFGHHHSNISPFLIGKTRLYTNQLGYTKFKEGAGFDRSAIIEL